MEREDIERDGYKRVLLDCSPREAEVIGRIAVDYGDLLNASIAEDSGEINTMLNRGRDSPSVGEVQFIILDLRPTES